jgi:hypothetical protein
MTFKLYSRLNYDKLVYEFELNSCISNRHTNTITELINDISEGSIDIYRGKQSTYEYFSTRSGVDPIVFLAECKFRDIDDMRCNLKTTLYNDHPELFI